MSRGWKLDAGVKFSWQQQRPQQKSGLSRLLLIVACRFRRSFQTLLVELISFSVRSRYRNIAIEKPAASSQLTSVFGRIAARRRTGAEKEADRREMTLLSRITDRRVSKEWLRCSLCPVSGGERCERCERRFLVVEA